METVPLHGVVVLVLNVDGDGWRYVSSCASLQAALVLPPRVTWLVVLKQQGLRALVFACGFIRVLGVISQGVAVVVQQLDMR